MQGGGNPAGAAAPLPADEEDGYASDQSEASTRSLAPELVDGSKSAEDLTFDADTQAAIQASLRDLEAASAQVCRHSSVLATMQMVMAVHQVNGAEEQLSLSLFLRRTAACMYCKSVCRRCNLLCTATEVRYILYRWCPDVSGSIQKISALVHARRHRAHEHHQPVCITVGAVPLRSMYTLPCHRAS